MKYNSMNEGKYFLIFIFQGEREEEKRPQHVPTILTFELCQ